MRRGEQGLGVRWRKMSKEVHLRLWKIGIRRLPNPIFVFEFC